MPSRISSDAPLTIRARALEAIAETIRASSHALETGGALFGADAFDVIEHATTPGPNATHAPAYFSRPRAHRGRVRSFVPTRWIAVDRRVAHSPRR